VKSPLSDYRINVLHRQRGNKPVFKRSEAAQRVCVTRAGAGGGTPSDVKNDKA